MFKTIIKTLAAVTAALALAQFGVAATAAAATHPAIRECNDPSLPITVEETRLAGAVPQQILARSDFAHFASDFAGFLCNATDLDGARLLAREEGKHLWEAAVARAQSGDPSGDLPASDDRPLYWARLGMTAALRQWVPTFALDPDQRTELVSTVDVISRGQASTSFPDEPGVKRVLVSGFDPFTLDRDIRIGNPSGANALALDGTLIDTGNGTARVHAVIFPVLWQPFEDGMVERTFLRHLQDGPDKVDMFMTVSQGRPERFDVERYNGRWHAGPDNNNETRSGTIVIPADIPTTPEPLEFVPTTLPYQAIVNGNTGRWTVHDNTEVVEIPAGGTDPVTQPNGPTPGSVARAGSGGNYLSNEVTYRTTLLREAVNPAIPGGHVHTPVLEFGQQTEITDPTFEQNRSDIIAQMHNILTVALANIG